MANLRTIQYAIHKDDGIVVSRVGRELAWPVIDFQSIGQDGDFTKPFDYNLAKFPLRWTKKIPVPLKNRHRKFWGMKPLKEESNG